MGLFHKWFLAVGTGLCCAYVLGCASTPSDQKFSCERSDWYEIGRRDGSSGLPAKKLNDYRQECGNKLRADDETLYTNGRNAGLVEYCTPQNAFELGRMKLTYYYVCPSTVEPSFLSAYKKGGKARNLEMENQKLAAKIEDLSQKMNAQEVESAKRRDIASEINELK
jgi:hypothetical protein